MAIPIEGGIVKYYASGWKNFGTTDLNGEAKLELLPGTYSFRMNFGGYTQQKSNINLNVTNPLEFETVEMVVNFKDSGDNPIEGGVVQYYASGWKDFGTTDGNGEAKLRTPPWHLLLPDDLGRIHTTKIQYRHLNHKPARIPDR